MRTQSEPPGPSIDGEEQQSLPSSPTSSAVTAISGRSSVGMGLQYKGSWCTPPRIFMDHQVSMLSYSHTYMVVIPQIVIPTSEIYMNLVWNIRWIYVSIVKSRYLFGIKDTKHGYQALVMLYIYIYMPTILCSHFTTV